MSITVQVRDGNVMKAMKILKKKLEKDGLMLELRRRMYYEKPSLKRAREHKQNIARCKKEKRLAEERDGYI